GRTSAVRRGVRRMAIRGDRDRADGVAFADEVAAVWGVHWTSGVDLGVVDLSDLDVVRSAEEPHGVSGRRTAASHGPTPVPVAGLRSLLRATGYVGRLALTRGWRT